jgi:syntaxin 1B/2/3
MSYNQYSGYGGNPYGQDNNNSAAAGGYGASNPYGSSEQNPYGSNQSYGDTVSRPVA